MLLVTIAGGDASLEYIIKQNQNVISQKKMEGFLKLSKIKLAPNPKGNDK